MVYRTFWLWLLVFAFGILGCSRAQSPSLVAEEKKTLGAWHPGEKVTYKWPDDFKLPLEIYIETPEVPREIQGPLPPIGEVKKQPTEQPAKKFPWIF